ncbi:hypothetical protein GO485_28860 [Pseudoduganella flava]|nr:hypothetical protein GO485_28860 [Pseudoduganella flava]
MEPRTMDVLVALCGADGAILSAEDLLRQCWGSTLHGDSPVHKNVALLRRLLGDDAGTPVFIETIRKRGYRTVAPVQFDVDERRRTPRWEHGSPFRGLLPFDETHADVFYGREEATRKLSAAAQARSATGLALLLLLGPSGSGKTSLVRAGLFPALMRDGTLLGTTTFDIADQGEQTLFCALAGTLLDLQWGDTWAFDNENAVHLGQRLEHDADGVAAQLRAAQPAGRRCGIFIDRFEALFNTNRVGEAERHAFVATLERLAHSGTCLVVVACRNDFYPNIAHYPVLLDAKVDLAPPAFAEIAQMIRKPAAAAQLTFGSEPGSGVSLDDVLCESAARSPDALPLLQYCLHELYRLRTPAGELSFAAFHELGGLEGALGQRAEQVVMGLTDAQRAELPHIMSLVTVLSAGEDHVTSQRAPWSALRGDAARQAVAELVEARLFTSDLAGGTPVFGIAHEAILRRWPRMSAWIAAHRDALRARARLAQQAARWHADGRPADLLIPRGKPLNEARDLQDANLWSLAPIERDLIRLSDRHARRFQWLRVSALVLIIVLAILNSALALNAYRAKLAAEARRAEVEGLMDFMLGDFADKLRPLGKLDLLESVSGKALQYLRGSRDSELGPAGLTLRAKALQVIGEASRARGNAAQALDALDKANAILMRQHQANPRDVQVLSNLGVNAYWVGQLNKDHHDLPAAEAAWRLYLRYSDMLHALEPDNVEWWIEQSYAHNNLGSLAHAGGRPDQAAPEFAASIALKERALARTPDSKMLIAELADSYSWLAAARQALGELDAAGELYQREMAFIGRLSARYPDEPLWAQRHVRALYHRATLAMAQGDDARAHADLSRAKALLAPIAARDPANHVWQAELADLDQELLALSVRRGAGTPLAALREVRDRLQALAARDPANARWARVAAVARTRLGAALLAAGDAAAADAEAAAALAQLRRLHAAQPASADVRISLVKALLLTAAIQQAQNKMATSIMTCRQAHGIIDSSTTGTMNFEILDPWLRVLSCLRTPDAANPPLERLRKIGYRDSAYLQFISKR